MTRRSTGGRPAIGRLPLVALAAAVAVLAVPLSSLVGAPDAGRPAAAERQDVCETARESCASVAAHGRDWRYSLVRSTAPTGRTVIVDLGGPGVSALSGVYRLGSYHRDLPELRGYNLLVVEEPWVTADLGDGCRRASSAYYRSARASAPDLVTRARELAGACEIGAGRWGFQPRRYADVVGAIVAKEKLELAGFVGHSFGSARYGYLSQAGQALDWAVLARPFPVGIDARTFVERRAGLILSMAGTPAAGVAAGGDRSVETTEFDRLSALVGLGYVPSADLAEVTAAVVRDRDAATIGQFSDQLWHRYGTDSISPAYLAQLDEVCAQTTGNGRLAGLASSGSVSGVIAATLLPCAAAPSSVAAPSATPLCVVTSRLDPVVAGDAALAAYRGGQLVTRSSVQASHNSREGLQNCVKEMVNR